MTRDEAIAAVKAAVAEVVVRSDYSTGPVREFLPATWLADNLDDENDAWYQDFMQRAAEAAVDAVIERLSAPGWRLVPEEPTDEMYEAWSRALEWSDLLDGRRWKAAVAASPSPMKGENDGIR